MRNMPELLCAIIPATSQSPDLQCCQCQEQQQLHVALSSESQQQHERWLPPGNARQLMPGLVHPTFV